MVMIAAGYISDFASLLCDELPCVRIPYALPKQRGKLTCSVSGQALAILSRTSSSLGTLSMAPSRSTHMAAAALATRSLSSSGASGKRARSVAKYPFRSPKDQ